MPYHVGDEVHYIFGDREAEFYLVIATRDHPHIASYGEEYPVPEGSDYKIVAVWRDRNPDRLSPYVDVPEAHLDALPPRE